MSISLRSFAKINLGLRIGQVRVDGFHELRTVYQTIAMHDLVTVEVQEGSGIEIRCADPRVPRDESNTCYKVAERVLKTAKARGKVIIEIEKRLPVQGGLGAASSNAVATMLGLERELGVQLAPVDKLRIAAEVGSDLPLFLIGGTVLGVGHGEEVYPLPELPEMHLVVVTPPVGVSTPRAFASWDEYVASRGAQDNSDPTGSGESVAKCRRLVSASNPDVVSSPRAETALTGSEATGTIKQFSHEVFAWLCKSAYPQVRAPRNLAFELDGVRAEPASGVPAVGGDRAETPLLDLVRAGIENDFERVVFPEYPDLHEVKRVLEREGARYASLSGSGATLYGVFASEEDAQAAAGRMRAAGHAAVATRMLTREEYWRQLWQE